MSIRPIRRISSSISSCLDAVDQALYEGDYSDDGEEFVRDGGRVGAIFLGGNHLGDKGVARIVDGLEDPCRDYYKLYLCDNRIGRLGALKISFSLKLNTKLKELSLGNNHIGNEGARHLASSLKDNNTLEVLNLENNSIGPAGTTALANALEHYNNTLHWLVLSENPIGDEGVKSMLRCIGNTSSFNDLQKCNHSLKSIILKKVTQVHDHTSLRKIQCLLKINRLSAPSLRLAAQRKILLHVKENPNALLEFFIAIRGDGSRMELCFHPLVLALLGDQYDLSTSFLLLQNSPHIFSNDPDIAKSNQQQKVHGQISKINIEDHKNEFSDNIEASGSSIRRSICDRCGIMPTPIGAWPMRQSPQSPAVIRNLAVAAGKEEEEECAHEDNSDLSSRVSRHRLNEDSDDFFNFLLEELRNQQAPNNRASQRSQHQTQSNVDKSGGRSTIEQSDYSATETISSLAPPPRV